MSATANAFAGRVKAVTMANVMAEVIIETESRQLISVVPKSLVVKLGITVGDQITALVSPADVLLVKDQA